MSDPIAFLMSDVARLLRRRFDERARTLGVTRAQWKVLLALSREEGLNQGQLADRIEVEPITLCRMIDRLEETGLVERRRDPADRRAWRIHLTQAAHPVIGDLRERAADLSRQALGNIAEAEQAQLARTLAAIHSNLGGGARDAGVDAGKARHG